MKDSLDIEISNNIKKEIETSGKMKSEIAQAIGVSNPTISQYCSGKIQPTLATLSRLCNFIDCSADDILGIKH
jgi:transcriptional regulator with XRE-family HTH domain